MKWRFGGFSKRKNLPGEHASGPLSKVHYLYVLSGFNIFEDKYTFFSTPFTPRTLEESCEYSGPRPSPTNIFSPAATAETTWAPSSCEGTCDEKGARKRLPHRPSLDTRGEAETRAAQEYLTSNCRRAAQDPQSHLGDRSGAGPERTGVGYLCCCPKPAQRHE